MTYLELLHAEPMTQLTPYLSDKIAARPVQRLVETKYLSLDEIHQSTITSECPDQRRARMMTPTMMR